MKYIDIIVLLHHIILVWHSLEEYSTILRSRVGVVLTSGVWTHGMAYVALGRVTDPANLRVAAPGNGKVIVNVVYRDVLAVGEARGAV